MTSEPLTHAVERLAEEVNALRAKTAVARRVTWTVVIGLILDVALSIGLLVIAENQQAQANQTAQLTSRLETAQGVQRQEALCPLYKLFIDAEGRYPATNTPEQNAERDRAFVIIHKSYDALKCDGQ